MIRIALAAVVLLAAGYDLKFRRIPNWLSLSGLILGFGLNVFFYEKSGALWSVQGVLLSAAVYLPLYCLRGMGAGDVKLMAAVGALVGPAHWFEIFLVTSLVGGGVAAVFALLKRRFTETCCNMYFLLWDLLHLRAPHRTNPQLDFRNPTSLRMPHGVLIALGSLLFLLSTCLAANQTSNLQYARILRFF